MHDQGSLISQPHQHFIIPCLLKNHMSMTAEMQRITKHTEYVCHPWLSKNKRLIHGIFTRRGGVSAPPFDSLNTSYSVGDVEENVSKNISYIKMAMEADELIFMNQRHGTDMALIRSGRYGNELNTPDADAMVTDVPGIALMVKQADCQGVIIYDTKSHVLALVHCGWRGNVRNILGKAVATMKSEFCCDEKDLLAAIGPSLGPCCGEFSGYEDIFPGSFERFMVRKNYFNLWALSRSQLIEAGIRESKIETAGICTRCRTDMFYSYRGEGRTGRFATVAMLL